MPTGAARPPLSRERVLDAAVALADAEGLDAVSMRRLAQDLGVVPMAIYKHVAHKDELLDGMADRVVAAIPPTDADLPWRDALRARVLDARDVMLRHPWARRVLEGQAAPTPVVLGHLDATIAILLRGGLSADLTHHVMHTLGSRVLGFSQELHTESTDAGTPLDDETAAWFAGTFPHVVAVATAASHDPASVVDAGCDDRFELEFTLDLLLDGIERLHRAGWTSAAARAARQA
ncbi:TetR/AcrR family transcriptional regulator [Cellulomonas fimi]|uniref:Regulatory protein TetR n=1 Tax=Cellulomonas fimi (strain ATCC 484 / DSM 20113 / JCM 1341 / CCUG 24087 / LMG 16345 / NBRC 15513 / NCIMB 8980 / NCTC 7547 / NRS-133) TaxID=590998 RepID=F4GZ60_CELFA|nr:TetR/AcrR family transcriptional regulator [Cellulomonas fimi]AEE47176.1 regulatory protein TetR [Cellulomonas fimi ATCC 484]NNH08996.1 TetR/AcrR family transcriptional regulator [Cellulomonas fimi]VEH35493.1 Tetracycline repressor protein class E [Cellulomonas fimi]